jgi:hypothetical protein
METVCNLKVDKKSILVVLEVLSPKNEISDLILSLTNKTLKNNNNLFNSLQLKSVFSQDNSRIIQDSIDLLTTEMKKEENVNSVLN